MCTPSNYCVYMWKQGAIISSLLVVTRALAGLHLGGGGGTLLFES